MWIWLLAGCNENFIRSIRDKQEEQDDVGIDEPSDEPAGEPTSEPDSDPSDEPADEPSSETADEPSNEPGTEPSNEPDDPVDPGDSQENPRRAYNGEVIINEVMIDSDSVQDKYGEWVELYNTTGDWLDLRQYRLRDQGVDDYEIQEVSSGSMIIEPNGFLVICAETDYWNNGGVTCQGAFLYQTFGGGFGLSNSEDEVILYSNTNQMIDRMTYVEGFSVIGASLGVSPSYATEYGNDYSTNWCDQWGFLPMGDSGSPGSINDICF